MSFTGSNIYFQDTETRIVSISFFDASTNKANIVSIQDFDVDDPTRMTGRIDAQKLSYDSLSAKWIALNGVERSFTNERQSASFFVSLTVSNLNFKQIDLTKKQQKLQEMNLDELTELKIGRAHV